MSLDTNFIARLDVHPVHPDTAARAIALIREQHAELETLRRALHSIRVDLTGHAKLSGNHNTKFHESSPGVIASIVGLKLRELRKEVTQHEADIAASQLKD